MFFHHNETLGSTVIHRY